MAFGTVGAEGATGAAEPLRFQPDEMDALAALRDCPLEYALLSSS